MDTTAYCLQRISQSSSTHQTLSELLFALISRKQNIQLICKIQLLFSGSSQSRVPRHIDNQTEQKVMNIHRQHGPSAEGMWRKVAVSIKDYQYFQKLQLWQFVLTVIQFCKLTTRCKNICIIFSLAENSQ